MLIFNLTKTEKANKILFAFSLLHLFVTTAHQSQFLAKLF